MTAGDEYNRPSFPLDMDGPLFAGFRDGTPHPGEPAPDGDMTDAATGERIKLSGLWRNSHLVIEFGSIT